MSQVKIHCGWCGDVFPAVQRKPWYDALDHALDFHRLSLLSQPERVRKFLRIVSVPTPRPVATWVRAR